MGMKSPAFAPISPDFGYQQAGFDGRDCHPRPIDRAAPRPYTARNARDLEATGAFFRGANRGCAFSPADDFG
jgi:hypothetical protein